MMVLCVFKVSLPASSCYRCLRAHTNNTCRPAPWYYFPTCKVIVKTTERMLWLLVIERCLGDDNLSRIKALHFDWLRSAVTALLREAVYQTIVTPLLLGFFCWVKLVLRLQTIILPSAFEPDFESFIMSEWGVIESLTSLRVSNSGLRSVESPWSDKLFVFHAVKHIKVLHTKQSNAMNLPRGVSLRHEFARKRSLGLN